MDTKKTTSSALSTMKRRYYKNDDRRVELEEARVNAGAARFGEPGRELSQPL